jgi:CHAT domain-containing protein/tetratricopeptide (TPR) repeat protein
MNNLLETVIAYVACSTWDEAHQYVKEHPELLGPQAATTLSLLAVDQPMHIVRMLVPHSYLLARAREAGVDRAFAEKLAPIRVISDDLMERLKAAQAADDKETLIALLRDHPELRPALKHGPLFGQETVKPPGFEDDIGEVSRLFDRQKTDPNACRLLISVYQRILARLQDNQWPAFRSTIQNDLGLAYGRVNDLEKAVACFAEALHFFKAETVPLEYAYTQQSLGKTYYYLRMGDRVANRKKAIDHFNEALRMFTPGAAPNDYAETLAYLGVAYFELAQSNIGDNLERAIDCFQKALPYTRPGSSPEGYARLQFNLGEAFRKLPTDDRDQNLQRAIKHYQEALRFLRPNSFPILYGKTQSGLGTAYRHSTGVGVDHLARAIQCFQEALGVLTPENAAEQYETSQRGLTECYQQWLRVQRLHPSPSNSDLAQGDQTVGTSTYAASPITVGQSTVGMPLIQAIKQFIDSETPPDEKDQASRRLSELFGNAFAQNRDASRAHHFADTLATIDRLAEALKLDPSTASSLIALCLQTLEKLRPEDSYVRYLVLNHLGIAYRNLPTGDAEANLRRAIECFDEALRLRSPERSPEDYAVTLNNLGNAYRNLQFGDLEANLRRAIACFEEALRLQTPLTGPIGYGIANLNLGTAYQDLPTGDLAANLSKAISCFEEALRFLTPESAALEYAGAQDNLGSAYQQLPTGDRCENLGKSLHCYREALRYRSAASAPSAFAQTQNNLGAVYLALSYYGDEEALALAIKCFEEGLRAITPEKAPRLCAALWYSLGTACERLILLDEAPDFSRAVEYYENALRLISPQSAPREHARLEASLGKLLARMSILEFNEAAKVQEEIRKAAADLGLPRQAFSVLSPDASHRWAAAIEHLKEAAVVCTVETRPRECREVNSVLGFLYGLHGRWSESLARYRVAIAGAERLYRAGMSERGKSFEAASNSALYRHAAFVAVRAGEREAAWLILERGKTRLLTEALRLGVPRPDGVPDEVWSAFEDAAAAVRAVQGDVAHSPFGTREQAVEGTNATLDHAAKRVRHYAADFLDEVDLMQQIQKLLHDRSTALVAFCICSFGSLAFVVSDQQTNLVEVVDIPTFGEHDLDELLFARSAGEQLGDGWVTTYRERGREAFLETIEIVLKKLGQQLLQPVLDAMPHGIDSLVFLPSGGLALFPLHAATLPHSPPERICDRFKVNYAPSVEVLLDLQKKTRKTDVRGVYQVVNPTEDTQLPYALREASAIGQLFVDRLVEHGRAATKQSFAAGVKGRTHIHCVCHGSYDWSDPRQSGLKLSDGCLTLADLQAGVADLSGARLVSLSACETGVTDIMIGSSEEYVGLPAGFLLAGAPCVVSSLWQVADLSTAMLMERFYYLHLVEGRSANAALSEAQRWLRDVPAATVAEFTEECYREAVGGEEAELVRRDSDHFRYLAEQSAQPPFAHPYYWAAFTVTGM